MATIFCNLRFEKSPPLKWIKAFWTYSIYINIKIFKLAVLERTLEERSTPAPQPQQECNHIHIKLGTHAEFCFHKKIY